VGGFSLCRNFIAATEAKGELCGRINEEIIIFYSFIKKIKDYFYNMTVNEYPHQNLSLKNIKGEKWEDIPGLVDYFMISNFGRVKRLEFQIQYDNGVTFTRAEKIISSHSHKQKNNFTKDFTDTLSARVILNKKVFSFTLTRMVYNCFVANFNLNDRSILVLCKDGNGLNITPKNLILVTPSHRSLLIYKRGRGESKFKYLSPEIKKKWREASDKAHRKQVSQYSLTGRRIKIYESLNAAESATGILRTTIGSVASGKGIAAGGYMWRWGKEKKVDVKAFKTEKQQQRRIKYGHKVTQYDFAGNKIAQFPSIRDAVAATG
jgi:hypothetical protein